MLRCTAEDLRAALTSISYLNRLKSSVVAVGGSSDWDNNFPKSHVLLSSFEFIGGVVYAVVHIFTINWID